jgi:ATP-binding cassette subfamily B (MDR/TAP) protein 1
MISNFNIAMKRFFLILTRFQTAMEAIENVRTVQSLTRERKFYHMFAQYLDLPFRNAKQKAIIQGLSYGFASSIFFFTYAAAFRFGVFLIIQHILQPMDVMRLVMFFSKILKCLCNLNYHIYPR